VRWGPKHPYQWGVRLAIRKWNPGKPIPPEMLLSSRLSKRFPRGNKLQTDADRCRPSLLSPLSSQSVGKSGDRDTSREGAKRSPKLRFWPSPTMQLFWLTRAKVIKARYSGEGGTVLEYSSIEGCCGTGGIYRLDKEEKKESEGMASGSAGEFVSSQS